MVSGSGVCTVFSVADLSGSVWCFTWVWFGTVYFYGILYGN